MNYLITIVNLMERNIMMSYNGAMKIMMSSCLIGHDVMYWGGNFHHKELHETLSQCPNLEIVHFCPEDIVLGTPRNNMLIHNGDGEDVWKGTAVLLDTMGNDLTDKVKEGAKKMLDFALNEKPDLIILTEGSDSCGINKILDPINFSEDGKNIMKSGMGVAAALLKMNGFKLLSHNQLKELKAFLKNTI